jgi:hypothetical protein
MMTAETPAERIRLLRSSPPLREAHFAFRNQGDLSFQDVSAAWGLNQIGFSSGTALGDLDGDGDLDIVYANFDGGVTVLRNDAPAGHRVIFELRGTRSNSYGVGAVVHVQTAAGVQVRSLVLARGYLSSSEPILHFGLGESTQIQRVTIDWPSGLTQVLENLAADRRYTVTEPDEAPKPLPPAKPARALRADGQFTEITAAAGLGFVQREQTVDEVAEQRLLPVRHNARGPALAVSDLNGDGRDDVCFGGTMLDPARIALQYPPGKFTPQPLAAAPGTVDDGPILIFSTQGHGQDDILITRGGASLPDGSAEYQPLLYLNSGSGLGPAPAGTLPPLHFSVGTAVAADWDHSGKLGLFLGGRLSPGEYPLAPGSALLANQGGRFVDVTGTVAPELAHVGMVTAALWTDVDGDGWVDLLLTLEWGGVRYFHNDHGRRLEDWSERAGFTAAGTGWWNSIAAADFNGDGRMDYVVGNAGLNTPYHADPAHPALLYYGDFGGSEGPQIIEARWDGDRIVPWRSRKELGAVLPAILRAFPKNDVFAQQSLESILGSGKLAAARRFTATELQSGVFLSQPDGTYRFTALPRIAQIAPIFGVVAGDFDGDGRADIYAVQNSFGPVASIGRFDGGLSQLLRGDGHGHFTAVPPAESSLVVPGDAKGLAVLDVDQDGWPDFLVSRNQSTPLLFRNRGVAGRHSFRVVLHGGPGNPRAVGACVQVELADGTRQAGEISAGSGYLSQSAPACFFGYADGNPPRRITIRWPDGHTTNEPWVEGMARPQLDFDAAQK